ncbi:hypothetical protein OLMES_3869 [Oleiphilus messinensis]|uniref:DUF4214 domain-containing protein n=1 Tax=Oleiphilus messinensis TaxID=141451 RepID=A0A1Y0ICM4_9GAMM|nr:DUF4214 domain-containing protein [Oleiphilus messinensis]ARU57889.1 hypothetical protein OLMES_3869 [Oleiphilus messinensis]
MLRKQFAVTTLIAGMMSAVPTFGWAASDASITAVQQAYVAYYGRPGDFGGVAFWAGELDVNGGDLSALIDVFGTSEEYQVRFGNLSTTELVNNLYVQMFGREAEADGLAFWVSEIDSGVVTLGQVALSISGGARGDDIATLDNRTEVAIQFTNEIEAQGKAYSLDQISSARDLILTVDALTDAATFVAGADFSLTLDGFPSEDPDNGGENPDNGGENPDNGGSTDGTSISLDQLAVLAQNGIWRSTTQFGFEFEQDMGAGLSAQIKSSINGTSVSSFTVNGDSVLIDSCDAAGDEPLDDEDFVDSEDFDEDQLGCITSLETNYFQVSDTHVRMELSCDDVTYGTVEFLKISDSNEFNLGALSFSSSARSGVSTGGGVCGDHLYVNSEVMVSDNTFGIEDSVSESTTISVRSPYGNSNVFFEFRFSGQAAPGSYTVATIPDFTGTQKTVSVDVKSAEFGGSASDPEGLSISSGSVTLSAVSDLSASGTFELVTVEGETLSGNFNFNLQ